MIFHKKLVFLIFVFGITVCAPSEAVDWFGSGKKIKTTEPPFFT